jgi:hypothetical protein
MLLDSILVAQGIGHEGGLGISGMIPAGDYIVQYDQERKQIACDTEDCFGRPKRNPASASQ